MKSVNIVKKLIREFYFNKEFSRNVERDINRSKKVPLDDKEKVCYSLFKSSKKLKLNSTKWYGFAASTGLGNQVILEATCHVTA